MTDQADETAALQKVINGFSQLEAGIGVLCSIPKWKREAIVLRAMLATFCTIVLDCGRDISDATAHHIIVEKTDGKIEHWPAHIISWRGESPPQHLASFGMHRDEAGIRCVQSFVSLPNDGNYVGTSVYGGGE